MKRMLLRLAALGLVVIGGFFAIAQAQRIMGQPQQVADSSAAPAPTTPDGEPLALAEGGEADRSDAARSASSSPRDPFASSRLIDSMAEAPSARSNPPTHPAKVAAEPPARYPSLATAAANPLRGVVASTAQDDQMLGDDQGVGASPTDRVGNQGNQIDRVGKQSTASAAPPADPKPIARRDPFGIKLAAAEIDTENASPAVALNNKALDDRYASPPAMPEPLPKSAAAAALLGSGSGIAGGDAYRSSSALLLSATAGEAFSVSISAAASLIPKGSRRAIGLGSAGGAALAVDCLPTLSI